MDYAAIVAAGISAITMLISSGQEEEAQRLREKLSTEYGPQILPDLDKAIAEQAGSAAPRSENAQGRNSQLDVLSELDNIYDTGGRTTADEAAYNQAGRKVSQRASQRSGEISMDAARRGQTNGPLGAVLASQSGQDELEALSSLNADVASAGRGRALQALGMKGQLATGLRGDDFRALDSSANATDIMNRFNASQRQQATMRNAGLKQQGYENNMLRLSAQGAAINGQAAGLDRQAAGTRQTGAGLANSAMSYGQAWDWGQEEKGKKK